MMRRAAFGWSESNSLLTSSISILEYQTLRKGIAARSTSIFSGPFAVLPGGALLFVADDGTAVASVNRHRNFFGERLDRLNAAVAADHVAGAVGHRRQLADHRHRHVVSLDRRRSRG